MADSKSSGFKGLLWSLAGTWIGAAGANLAGWFFPSVDAFFESSGKAWAAVWAFLTVSWSVPAVPLVLGFVLLGFLLLKLISRPEVVSYRDRESAPPPKDIAEAIRVAIPGRDSMPLRRLDLSEKPPPELTAAESAILRTLLHADQGFVSEQDLDYSIADHPAIVLQDASASLQTKGMVKVTDGRMRNHSLTPEGKAFVIKQWNQATTRF